MGNAWVFVRDNATTPIAYEETRKLVLILFPWYGHLFLI